MKFAYPLVAKRARPAIKRIINNFTKISTMIKTNKCEAYYWLGKIMSAKTHQLC